jgi:hypothetical protein
MKKAIFGIGRGVWLAAAVFALLVMGCQNTVDEPLVVTEYEDALYDDGDSESIESGIVFADAMMVANTDTVNAGEKAGTVSFPDTEEGVWEAAFVPGPGATHNKRFNIVYVYDEKEPSVPIGATFIIKEGEGPLRWGRYSVRVRVSNEESGLAFTKVFAFEVTQSPAPFKEAPRMYPYVVEEKNKMVIKWVKRPATTSYTVYAGTTANFNTASLIGTVNASADSVEFSAVPGGSGDLPINTYYWAWVTATNAAGTTPPSPAARKKTTAPVQPYFYENKDDKGVDQKEASYFDCGGYGDYYRFTPTQVKYWFGSQGGYNYIGDILYHEIFDPQVPGSNYPFPTGLKNNPDVVGLPAGVFVLKYPEGYVPGALTQNDTTPNKMKRYSAVYYWGMGATVPSGMPNAGKVQAGIVNQWNNYAETVTYEEAIDKFTAANIRTFLGLMPEPYYKHFADDMSAAPHYEVWIGEGRYNGED